MRLSDENRVAVLGAGIAGLTTAHTLLDAGLRVRVYTNTRHVHATSHVACAIWLPTASEVSITSSRTMEWGFASREIFERTVTDEWGVFRGRTLELFGDVSEITPDWRQCFPGATLKSLPVTMSPWTVGLSFDTLYVDTPIYLPRLARQLVQRGGSFFDREIVDVAELMQIPERRIVNCLGAASSRLFNDSEMNLVTGQTLLFDQIKVPVGVGFGDYCVYPRSSGTLVGALAKETADPHANPSERMYEQLIDMLNCYAPVLEGLFGYADGTYERLTAGNVTSTFSGVRPVRLSGPRLEAEFLEEKLVIHNYGHGGIGVSIAWGAAHQAASLLLSVS